MAHRGHGRDVFPGTRFRVGRFAKVTMMQKLPRNEINGTPLKSNAIFISNKAPQARFQIRKNTARHHRSLTLYFAN